MGKKRHQQPQQKAKPKSDPPPFEGLEDPNAAGDGPAGATVHHGLEPAWPAVAESMYAAGVDVTRDGSTVGEASSSAEPAAPVVPRATSHTPLVDVNEQPRRMQPGPTYGPGVTEIDKWTDPVTPFPPFDDADEQRRRILHGTPLAPDSVTPPAPGSHLPESVTITVPLGLFFGGRVPRTIAFQRLPCKALGVVLRSVREGLDQNHARLANGRHVESDAHAIRYLLEQIALQIPDKVIQHIENTTT